MQFNVISCLCEHSLGDIMRYKNSFQLASTCEESLIWCQNCEDYISIGIGGWSLNSVYQEICLQIGISK